MYFFWKSVFADLDAPLPVLHPGADAGLAQLERQVVAAVGGVNVHWNKREKKEKVANLAFSKPDFTVGIRILRSL